MKRVVFITPPEACPGFELAGMTQLPADAEDAITVLEEQFSDENTGLVAIDERLCDHVPQELLARLDREQPGKITIIPSPLPGSGDLAVDLIRQAIGYHVRFKG